MVTRNIVIYLVQVASTLDLSLQSHLCIGVIYNYAVLVSLECCSLCSWSVPTMLPQSNPRE